MALRLVVGLGNPGPEYERTRHNIGFRLVDRLVGGADLLWKDFKGLGVATKWGEVWICKPMTFMNDSGRSVAAASAFFKVPVEQILVVHDEVDLETGRLQVRAGGGLAGHNGLRSIARTLGSQDFLRLRVGVGRPVRGDPRPVADYVLSPFAPEDDSASIIVRAADAVETLTRDGLDRAVATFN